MRGRGEGALFAEALPGCGGDEIGKSHCLMESEVKFSFSGEQS